MALSVIVAMSGQSDRPFAILIALLAPWAMGVHMVWQMRVLDIDNNEICLKLFRANRDTGLIPLLFFAGAMFV